MIAPVLFWVILIVAGLLRPGYNPIRQYGSELGVGPHAWLMNGAFIAWGLLQICFAWGLEHGVRHGRGGWLTAAGPALVALAGVCMVLVGVFHASPGAGSPSAASMHYRAAKWLFRFLIVAFFVLAWRFHTDPRWRSYAPYSVGAGIVALALFAFYGGSPNLFDVAAWPGLEQRLLLAVTTGWLGVLALRLYRVDTELTHPDGGASG